MDIAANLVSFQNRYQQKGVQAFRECIMPLPPLAGHTPVRLYTVLRDPVEKFLSGVWNTV